MVKTATAAALLRNTGKYQAYNRFASKYYSAPSMRSRLQQLPKAVESLIRQFVGPIPAAPIRRSRPVVRAPLPPSLQRRVQHTKTYRKARK